MKTHTHNINSLIQLFQTNSIAFVCYRKPNEKDIIINIFAENNIRELKSYNEINEFNGFIFHPFETKKEQPALLLSPQLSFTLRTVPRGIESELEAFSFKTKKTRIFKITETTKSDYFSQINTMLSELKDNKLKKVILSRPIIKDETLMERAGLLFKNLNEKYSSAFVYYLHIPNRYSWLGATPELFFKKENGKCTTTALAGTVLNTEQKQVNWNDKEIVEQAIVTEYIKEVLTSNKIKKFKMVGPETVSAGNLFHLQTKFTFSDSSIINFGKFLKDLHPTPAVCGLPKQDAISLINNTESFQREFYSGFLGEISNKETNLFVNLRCLQFIDNKAVLYVGGGLTADSIPEKEWEEAYSKERTLMSVLKKK